ncbi:hypothetical protein VTN77DRAFT_9627 [Rasamsonia byssochlamydoides]|uniref:uncharacterized protein n=1 Tax=Rasamsonia byssochlamydoides TaxID=89139 RepID=UPI00374217C4
MNLEVPGQSSRRSSSDLSRAPSDVTTFVNVKYDAEPRLNKYKPNKADDSTVSVLQAFLKYLPQDGKKNVVADIAGCEGDEQLYQLSLSLVEGLLFPMKAHGKTPSITLSPRFGLEDSIENVASQITEPATRNSQRWLKQACLSRDGNKCVIAGSFDSQTAALEPNQSDALEADTELAHIIPFSRASYSTEEEHHRISEIWVTIFRYFPSVRSRINFIADSINHPRNAMTMHSYVHRKFGDFTIALEKTEREHVYQIKNYNPRSDVKKHLPSSGIVAFTNYDPQYELPSPILLEVHAVIARILHATGKGEEADRLLEEKDKIGVLAKDGSTNVRALLSVTNLSSRATSQKPTNAGTRQMTDNRQENV